MTPEEEKYYEHYADLFATQGWKQFIEDMVSNFEGLNQVQNIKDSDSLFYTKGQLDTLARIVNFQAFIEQSRDNME
jgi:hypothetical protein